MRATYGVCLHNFFWRQCCPAWLAPGLTGPAFAFDDCSCGMLKSERIWFSGMSYFYPRHSYMMDQPLRIRAGASPICLNPMTLTYVKKSTFTFLGGTEFFFPILCQDGKIFLGRTNPRKCLTNNSIQPKKNEEKSSPRFF